MKWYSLFFLSLFLVSSLSCDRTIRQRMDSIENELIINPSGAYEELSRMDTKSLYSEAGRARYALLMSLARDKSYVDVADDSLIQVAVRYYEKRGSMREKMISTYLLGRVQRNADNKAGAIVSFLKAKKMAGETQDYHYYGLACRNIAALYGACNDEDSELSYYKEATGAFCQAHEDSYAAYSQLGEARVYMAKGMTEVSDSVLSGIESYARKHEDINLLNQVLMDRAINHMASASPDPVAIISLYEEASGLGIIQKETVDYGTLALAYDKLNKKDSVSYYLNEAELSVRTRLDSAHLYNTLSVLYGRHGNFEKANEQIKKGIELHNRIVFNRENQFLANAISNYSQKETARQSAVASYQLRLLVLSSVTCITLFCLILVLVYVRRKQVSEKNRIIREREQKIEEDMAQIQLIAEELRRYRDDSSEMANKINGLVREKIEIVKICADAYEKVNNEPKANPRDPYKYLDEDPNQRKVDEMNRFLQALDGVRKDEALFSLLEESVDKWRNGIMQRLRASCSREKMHKPQFSEDDLRIMMLFYAGIPDRTIAYLMNMSCAAIRTRKTRYKERLIQSDVLSGSEFVKELGRLPK